MLATGQSEGAKKAKILVVDDESDNLDLFQRALRDMAQLTLASNGSEALEELRAGDYRVVLADHLMPGLTGVELMERAACIAPQTERILVSGYGDVDVLTDAINRGHVSQFLSKPIDVDELRTTVKKAIAATEAFDRSALVLASKPLAERMAAALRASDLDTVIEPELLCQNKGEITIWPADVSSPVVDSIRRAVREETRRKQGRVGLGAADVIGRSRTMQAIFDSIEQVAATDATVLIRGETGTGKELIARVIHSLSARSNRHFVAVNCAALPESLVESELFGHEKGAFTGAQARKLGRFERADGGTLFIDEVGEIPASVQVKLLRAIQERSFERVGGVVTQRVDIRLIAATNRNLEVAIEEGKFREDLFYRLNVVPLTLPPLRERREDLPLLIDYFLGQFQSRLGKEGISIADEMRDKLVAHGWPGNVRELMNVIERAVALTPSGGVVQGLELRGEQPRQQMSVMVPQESSASLKEQVEHFERQVIVQALDRCGGNRTRAAGELGITRQGLSLKIRKYSL